jgi:RNA polymerase-interacting CarD/CdnL/TRCF family regulator
MMTEDGQQVEAGDWFVHAHFGAGRVKGQEVKAIGEQEQSYYELETVVCTLWLPEDKLFGQKIRPLANEQAFQEAIDVLKSPSAEMSADANKRKLRIKQVKTANAPTDTASLVRDLWTREQAEGKLYDWERQAWREMCAILIQEWALCLGISSEEARQQVSESLTNEQNAQADDDLESNGASSLLGSVASDLEKWSDWRAETS